jgi:hypothetical protein
VRSSRSTVTERVLARPLGHVMGLSRYQVLFAAGTLFAWAHTVDEVRIGQLIALPFALANTFALFKWSRMPEGWRAALAIAFGLLWIVTVIPYHVVPLLHGMVTWQNVSGLSRIVGGAILIATGAVSCVTQARGSSPRR